MTLVLDVSGVAEILFQKEKVRTFGNVIKESTLVVTPDIYIAELTNTLWKYFSEQEYTRDECLQYIRDGIGYIDTFINSKDIWEEALAEGIDNKHATYDMFYMVTARRYNATLITRDSVLAAVCKKHNVQICY